MLEERIIHLEWTDGGRDRGKDRFTAAMYVYTRVSELGKEARDTRSFARPAGRVVLSTKGLSGCTFE